MTDLGKMIAQVIIEQAKERNLSPEFVLNTFIDGLRREVNEQLKQK